MSSVWSPAPAATSSTCEPAVTPAMPSMACVAVRSHGRMTVPASCQPLAVCFHCARTAAVARSLSPTGSLFIAGSFGQLHRVKVRSIGSFDFDLALADDGPPFGQLALQMSGELYPRAIDQRVSKCPQPIPHFGQRDDLADLPMPECNDVVRRSRRKHDAIPKPDLVVRDARLIQRWNVRKFGSPRRVGDRQQSKFALAHQRGDNRKG